MTETLLPIVCATVLLAYWSLCRKLALRQQIRAVELIEDYLENESVSELDKEGMYWTYRAARTWFFMPMIALLMPFCLIPMLYSKSGASTPKNRGEVFDEIMECLVKMYATRNPLTAMISLSAILLTFAIMLTIAVLLDRVKHIPSLIMMLGAATSKATDIRSSHAH